MIDTKELRSAVESAGLNAISGEEVLELLDRLEAAESECLEEARLNGMGSEREAALMAKLEAAEKSDAESLAMYRKARDERDALRAEIEELHVLIAAVKKRADAEFRLRVKKEEEYTRLRAKIERMERQEPAYWGPKHAIEGGSTTVIVGKFPVNPTDAPLYALPGAQGEKRCLNG